jgi:hypothetical protein
MCTLDDTIPTDIRLSLYLSARLLQELQLALQLIGIPSTYIRPGVEGIDFPRLHLGSTTYEPRKLGKAYGGLILLDYFICAVPLPLPGQRKSRLVPPVEWWFMWWSDLLEPICPATDMKYAARVIVEDEESA